MVQSVLDDLREGIPRGILAARFHHTLAAMILGVAEKAGIGRVVLTGGCFQNKYLTEHTVRILSDHGFRAYWHQRIPPNDGGIALGQIAAVVHRREQHQNASAGYHGPEDAGVSSHSIMRSIG
jgi:hydrogenase maturation protein HypF